MVYSPVSWSSKFCLEATQIIVTHQFGTIFPISPPNPLKMICKIQSGNYGFLVNFGSVSPCQSWGFAVLAERICLNTPLMCHFLLHHSFWKRFHIFRNTTGEGIISPLVIHSYSMICYSISTRTSIHIDTVSVCIYVSPIYSIYIYIHKHRQYMCVYVCVCVP